MEFLRILYLFPILDLLSGAGCSDDVHDRLDLLEDDMSVTTGRIDAIETQMSADKQNIINKQRRQIVSLKRELRREMKKRVKDALDEILSGDNYRDIIQTKVAEEVGHFTRSHQQMRQRVFQLSQEVSTMKKSLGVVHMENTKLRKALEKEPRCQCKTGEASRPSQTSNHSSVSATSTSYPVTSTVAPTTRRPRLTTPAQEEKNYIFVMPRWQSSKHHPRLVNIHSNNVSVYSHLPLKQVRSVVYVSKLNSLFFGLGKPYKIISSELNSSSVKPIKDNVLTYGMAVDDKIPTVFMTTAEPTKTISRMRLDGGKFSIVVSLSGYRRYPYTIAVDTNTKIIYTCNHYNLLSVKYDGSGLTTLDTGDHILAVTLDIINGVLYYGNSYNLMQRSLSNTNSTEVTGLTDLMWNLVYYRDVVYYMSYYGTVGSVDVGQNNKINTSIMQTKPVSGVEVYIICLIP